MQKVLMLTPHLSKWRTCIMQPWMPAFDASKPQGTRMPVWLTLKNVPEEFLSSAQEMAGNLGIVMGRHQGNSLSADQKFCVAVKTGVPFDLVLEAVNPVNGEATLIQVDYNNLPIRCRYCLSTSHLIKNCPSVAGHNRSQRGAKSDRSGAYKSASGDKGKGTGEIVAKKTVPKVGGAGGDGEDRTVTTVEKANKEAGNQSPTPKPVLSTIDIASISGKSVEPMVKEDLMKGRIGGASSSSSVDKLLRPHKSIKKGNTHTKPFMTWELWKACELATGQALSPKRGDFSDINEFNNCCRKWRARESQHLQGDRSSDVQILSRYSQEGVTRRNLEVHLSAAANKQSPLTPSLQAEANTDSKLTGASSSVRSLSPSEGDKQQGNGAVSALQLKVLEEGECEGQGSERIDENVDSGRDQGGQSEARGGFDLNNTIHLKMGGKFFDDLGFSTGAQGSDSGTVGFMEGIAQQNQLLSHMILVVREWLRGQGLRVHLPSSPLGPRLSKKTIDRRNGPGGSRPSWKEVGSLTDQRGAAAVIRLEDDTQPNTTL